MKNTEYTREQLLGVLKDYARQIQRNRDYPTVLIDDLDKSIHAVLTANHIDVEALTASEEANNPKAETVPDEEGEEYRGYVLRKPSDDFWYPFKARPYDEASYYRAVSTDGGKTWLIRRKSRTESTVTGTWREAVDMLVELNANIEPMICHN